MRATRVGRVCETCGADFTAPPYLVKRGGGRFCSIACKATAQRAAMTVQCATCGKKFQRKPSVAARITENFCSKSCKRQRHTKAPRICEVCHSEFVESHGHLRRQRYCSPECGHAAQRNRMQRTCKTCGKRFSRKPSDLLKEGAGSFCSVDCKAGHMSASQLTTSGVNRNTARGGGYREDLGFFVRSGWEANYARYLKWLSERGDVLAWDFEPQTFRFKEADRVRFYTPDFRVQWADGRLEYHEIKGWKGAHDAAQVERMAKHYPTVSLVVIELRMYQRLRNEFKSIVPGWE